MEKILTDLDRNIKFLADTFENDDTFKIRRFETIDGYRCAIFFCDGMVNNREINDAILKPITEYRGKLKEGEEIFALKNNILNVNDVKIEKEWEKIWDYLLYGDTVLLCDFCEMALIINTKGFTLRSISEPGNEKILLGPKEGFNEGIMMNISLLRRKLKTKDLKLSFLKLGKVSNTSCCIAYIEGIADKKVLEELKKRLEKLDIDGVVTTNYLCETISDQPYSPVNFIGKTERPDVVSARLLEGRVALFVDGTPVVLTVPHIFTEQFQSPEDYYVNFYFAALSRIIREFGFVFSVSVLPIYISLITYHPEMLPTSLLISISTARNSVPLPTILEAIALMLAFDILREAGKRTPTVVGQTMGIVGALILGQAAVEARLVSAPMIIMVAFSGITGLMVPNLRSLVTFLRVFLIILSSMLGIYGYIFGALWFLSHLSGVESFGISMLSNLTTYRHASKEDSLIRMPWRDMKPFGRFLGGKK